MSSAAVERIHPGPLAAELRIAFGPSFTVEGITEPEAHAMLNRHRDGLRARSLLGGVSPGGITPDDPLEKLLARSRKAREPEPEPAQVFDADLIPDLGEPERSRDDDEIDRLIDGLDIVTAYDRWIGKPHKDSARRESYMVSCPVPGHEDKNPSAWMNLDKRVWHCGVCDQGGDVYDLAAFHFGFPVPGYKDGKTFRELRERMAESLGYIVKRTIGGEKGTSASAVRRSVADGSDEGDFITRALVDWRTVRDEISDAQFTIEPLIAEGRAHLLYASMKSGKSLLMLWMLAEAALGRAVFDRPNGRPLRTLYLDAENSLDDVVERLDAFGIDTAELADAGTFAYALLPQITRGIDNHVDAAVIVERARAHDADLVVIDTTPAFVAGDENSADTWGEVARLLTRPLKFSGIASIRIDHSGRDTTRGPRGSSAKVADADLVWELIPADAGGFTLHRKYARMPWVPARVDLHRREHNGVIGWVRVGYEWPAGTKETAETLDQLDVPIDCTSRYAERALKEAGQGKRKAVVLAAIRYRRELGNGR